MNEDTILTQPKPFVFVLMPFEKKFDDLYKFGIKGAAEDAGAYAERLDEQVFTEGMLDRIFNQISKADVIVADMTGRNPNVFYEVGYAHALGKIVLLITNSSDDIPFDLKHRQHIVYQGGIDRLRKELMPKLLWAIKESKARSGLMSPELISVRLHFTELVSKASDQYLPIVSATTSEKLFSIALSIRNDSPDAAVGLSHIYLFTAGQSALVPTQRQPIWTSLAGTAYVTAANLVPDVSTPSYGPMEAMDQDSADGLNMQYRLPIVFEKFPPGAIEQREVWFQLGEKSIKCDETMRLRVHSEHRYWEYRFHMQITLKQYAKK